MSKTPILTVEDLRVTVGSPARNAFAVDGVSFSLYPGETFALLGESGCGKSMTALALMQLLPPVGRIAGGHVFLDGRDLVGAGNERMRAVRGHRIAMIFQEPHTALNPVMSVAAQVSEVLTRTGLKKARHRERVQVLLGEVGISDPVNCANAYPHQLSGGMQQRVAIAMALAGEPEVLIADEPTTALDVTIQAQVLDLLRRLQASKGMALLLITHDLGVVGQIAHRVGVMYAGQLVEQAPVKSLYAHPRHPYAQGLFAAVPDTWARAVRLSAIPGQVPALMQMPVGCRFAPRCRHAWEECEQKEPEWNQPTVGHGVRCFLYEQLPSLAPAYRPNVVPDELVPAVSSGVDELLLVEGLSVSFPIQRGILRRSFAELQAVRDVSLAIRPGRTLAVVGESGCGKTSLAKAIVQLVKASRGVISLQGQDLIGMDSGTLRRCRAHMQMIFQDSYASMNPRMKVAEIISEGLVIQASQAGVQQHRERVDVLLQQVGLSDDLAMRYPHELSGGQRQRVCIARALAVNPKLIICDEPTSALDVSVQAQILNLMRNLQEELGVAYLLITHDLSVVNFLADEVVVMYLGKVVERGLTREVLRSPKHPYTQALLAAVPKLKPHSNRETIRLEGEAPSPLAPPSGCPFHPRCRQVLSQCSESEPAVAAFGATHNTACHLYAPATQAE